MHALAEVFPYTSIMDVLSSQQQARFDRFGVAESVDMHCHIVPGVDDGPAGMEDAVALARALVRDGISTVIATPHQLGRWEGQNPAANVRAAIGMLQQTLETQKIPLKLLPGAEVRLDAMIPRLLERDIILTLADARRYLLLELPSQVPMDAETVLKHLAGAKVCSILAHAERYDMLQLEPDKAQDWIASGAVLQVNAGAVVGKMGQRSQAVALGWIERGWVSLIATDAHSLNTRRPRMTEAIDLIVARFGEEIAKRLCLENPLKVAKGEAIAPPQT